MKRKSSIFCFVSIFGILAGLLCSTAPARGGAGAAEHAPAVSFHRDIVYGNAGGTELHLDLARPAQTGGTLPCIIFIHGGGWAHGSKAQFDPAIRIAADKGYVAATIDYRLAPQFKFPAQVEDAKCAVRYLRSHAKKYGIDPNRIGALGDSAGGHLVLMLAVAQPQDHLEGAGGWSKTSSNVQAVVSWYGPTDLAAADMPEISKPIVREFLGRYPDPESCRKASPITYVHPGECPILLLQGTMDPLVPYTQAVIMARAMSDARVPGRAELLIGAGHGFFGEDREHAIEASAAFLDHYLRQKRISAPTNPRLSSKGAKP